MANLGTFLQENILTVLAFDETRAKLIRGSIEVENFSGQYRELAVKMYDYLDRYGKPVGEHLPDVMEDKLQSDNKREATLYADIIENLYATREGINAEYIMSQCQNFVRRQALRTVAVDLAKALQKDTEAGIEEAERLMASANTQTLKVFEPGLRLNDKMGVLKFLDIQAESIPTGIPELDKRGFGPTPKELHLYIADKKKGKSWWLTNLAKAAIMNQKKVVHITLEMSEERTAQRYMQAMFSLAKRKEKVTTQRFVRDKLGRVTDFETRDVTPKIAFEDDDVAEKLGDLIDMWGDRALKNVFVKQFPTGQLTVRELIAYLDNLELTQNFIPDLLIIDYPDLMKTDKDNLRGSLDQIYKDIRGLLVARNMAGAIVSQSNRSGASAQTVRETNVSEDYKKLAHADCALTYSQTPGEKALGLARITVVAGRNDGDGITIVVSQAYGIGQYVVDSNLLIGNYWDVLKREAPEDEAAKPKGKGSSRYRLDDDDDDE